MKLARGQIIKFVIPYTIGTCLALCGSLFLSGPVKQCKKMFHKKRMITTIVMLSSIAGCVLFAFLNYKWAVLACVIVQYASFFWYSLSYIPYGRTIFCKCFKGCCLKGGAK